MAGEQEEEEEGDLVDFGDRDRCGRGRKERERTRYKQEFLKKKIGGPPFLTLFGFFFEWSERLYFGQNILNGLLVILAYVFMRKRSDRRENFPLSSLRPFLLLPGRGEASARQARKKTLFFFRCRGATSALEQQEGRNGCNRRRPWRKEEEARRNQANRRRRRHFSRFQPRRFAFPSSSHFLLSPSPRRSVGRKALAVGVAVAVVTYDWPE